MFKKLCAKCGIEQPVGDYFSKGGGRGLRPECKTCFNKMRDKNAQDLCAEKRNPAPWIYNTKYEESLPSGWRRLPTMADLETEQSKNIIYRALLDAMPIKEIQHDHP